MHSTRDPASTQFNLNCNQQQFDMKKNMVKCTEHGSLSSFTSLWSTLNFSSLNYCYSLLDKLCIMLAVNGSINFRIVRSTNLNEKMNLHRERRTRGTCNLRRPSTKWVSRQCGCHCHSRARVCGLGEKRRNRALE